MALRLNDELTWHTFLREAEIPDADATAYAQIFHTNRINERTVKDLTKELLVEIGITRIGDILAILDHIRTKTNVTPSSNNNLSAVTTTTEVYRPPHTSVKMPTISAEMTHPQFRKLKVDWDVYKKIVNIPPAQIGPLLYNACEQQVQSSIVNSVKNFFQLTEEQMLEEIEGVVTHRVNPAVHRRNFNKLQQQENESMQDFRNRLNTEAVDCEYSCPECSADISWVNIRDQFISGLNNEPLQTDILAKADQLPTVDDVVKHAEAFESAIRDQSNLNDSSDLELSRLSEYRKGKRNKKAGHNSNKNSNNNSNNSSNNSGSNNSNNNSNNNSSSSNDSNNNSNNKQKSCSGCGSTTHGIFGTYPRHSHCPAWGTICVNCNRPNHDAAVCRQDPEISGMMICSTDDPEAPETLEEVTAKLTPKVRGGRSKAKNMKIFPDSGSNVCLTGIQQVQSLGVKLSQLRKLKKRKQIKTVGKSKLNCIGWIPVTFEIDGERTTQPLLITDEPVDRIYFSKKACVEVRILHPSYPKPMPRNTMSCQAAVHSTETKQSNREAPPPKPSQIPFPPTPENVPKLKKYIVDKFSKSAFNADDTPFPALSTPPFKVHLKPDAVPHAVHTPIPIPHHWKEATKASLDRDVERVILKRVDVNTPVTWCAQMIVVEKPDGTLRRVVDYQHLSSQSYRQTHFTHSPFNLASQVPPNTKKTVIDAVDGFHSVQLDEESCPLFVFITEFGRYMPLRLPQGYFASGDGYTHRTDDIILSKTDRALKIIDDTLIHDNSIEKSFYHTWDVLTIFANNGITANLKKFQFCQDTVEFAGFNITPTGVAPSDKILEAIRDFPSPKDLTGARSWFGLVNQIAWAYSMTPIMAPFRDLIKPNRTFFWDETLERIFQSSKAEITKLVKEGVQSFDINKPTCIQTDWCKDGLGYLLLQKHCACTEESPVCCKEGWKLIYAGSRFTKPAESRYSPTEGEALALKWALQHSRLFTLGCPNLLAAVDHKPLLGIFNNRELASISNPRIQSMKEDTLPWKFKIIHCPGKWTRGPDALSRQRRAETESVAASLLIIRESPIIEEDITTPDMVCHAAAIHAISKLGSITLDSVQETAEKDTQYQNLLKTIKQGFPSSRDLLPNNLREYWGVHNRLSVMGGIALMDKRIVVPLLLRKIVLDNLHSANQGVTGMKFRANQSVYWPGLDASIRNHRAVCMDCIKHAPSNPPEPLILTPSPDYPFQQVCADYFSIVHHSYLTVVDRFSGWLCVYHCKKNEMDAKTLINIFRELFVAYGVSEEISSDGGPQFKSKDFQDFLAVWGVKWRPSSASYPQSNGRAELGVKTAKRIIHNNVSADGSLNNDSAARAILEYRNTPLPDLKLSPAQILFHRQLRDSVPTHPSHYRLHRDWVIDAEERERAYAKRNALMVQRYNKHARELPSLQVGTDVIIQSQGFKKAWDRTGRIVAALPNRQYRVKMMPSGRISLQNRRFLQALPSSALTLQNNPSLIPSPLHTNLSPSKSNINTPVHSNANNTQTLNTPDVTTMRTTRETQAPTPSSTTPNNASVNRIPRMLRNLQTFNKPGLKELNVGGERR